ncbi:MAG TPA: ATP-binding protein [Rhizomicrobium sp.]|nr:ATP-binding protein [Rhizomicrobium sp.]
MTEADAWQDENTRYLSAAVAWVRAALEQKAGGAPKIVTATASPTGDARKPFWRGRGQPRDALAPVPDVLMLPPETGARLSQPPEEPPPQAEKTPPALVTLRERLGLTRFEQDVLVLCAAMELDTSIAGLCARAQSDPLRGYPTFALALSLFEQPSWDVLSPERALRHWRLVEINQPAGQTLTSSPLRADEWAVNYIKGLTYLDDRLAPLISPMTLTNAPDAVPPSQRDVASRILDRLKQGFPNGALPPIQLIGGDGASKAAVAGLICGSFGLATYRLPAAMVPAAPADLESFARLWQRQSLLLPIALYIDARDADAAQSAATDRLLSRLNCLVILDAREPWPGLQNAISADVAKPTPAEQRDIWMASLGASANGAPALLASQFHLNAVDIRAIAQRAVADSTASKAEVADTAWRAALAATRPRLDNLAQRISPKVTWDDIVLLPNEAKLLRQIADQVGNRAQVYQDWGFERKTSRGLGINALFAGESGTGKTMAAEVIANHLKLDLYRIDLSAVVSKYIGETEKNLRKLFDAAEDGGAILFFDEADALFGKRTEVKDSHDRYANIEVNYLLQRMETYGGLAILATNMKSTLDQAFLRRLRFIVNFHFPAAGERQTIWRKAFPKDVPLEGLDYDRLARLNLTGGQIALIALNAAFAAAQAKAHVTMPIVLDCARTEFRKLERPVHEPDFRWPPANVRVA